MLPRRTVINPRKMSTDSQAQLLGTVGLFLLFHLIYAPWFIGVALEPWVLFAFSHMLLWTAFALCSVAQSQADAPRLRRDTCFFILLYVLIRGFAESPIWHSVASAGMVYLLMLGGGWVGSRVVKVSHLTVLIIVAATADLLSVFMQGGYTQELVQDLIDHRAEEHWLVLYINRASEHPEPLVGLADLLFGQLLVTSFRRFFRRPWKIFIAMAGGISVGLLVVATTQIAMPLLPFMGAGALCVGDRRLNPSLTEWRTMIVFLVFLTALCWFAF